MASAKFRSVGRPTDLNLAGAILFRDIFQTIPPQVDNRTENNKTGMQRDIFASDDTHSCHRGVSKNFAPKLSCVLFL